MVRRTVAAAVSAALLGVFASPVIAGAEPAPAGGLPGVGVPTLSWTDCGGGYQCATAQVPLDYRDPSAGTIPVAVNRKPATDPAKRIGVLLVNPGGPGGSGLGFAQELGDTGPVELRERYDIVGFDPRGVGESSPVRCMSYAEYTDAWATAVARPVRDPFQEAVRTGKQFADACARESGHLLPYIGTEFVARDMDLLRAALGEEKVSYFGVSFGTFIGTVYANLFPNRLRYTALDGAYNPANHVFRPYTADRLQYLAVDGAMKRFFAWCDADPARCGFGNGNAEQALYALQRNLDANPIKNSAGKVVANGASTALRLIFSLGIGSGNWPTMGSRLTALGNRTGSYATGVREIDLEFLTPNVAVECADREFKFGLRFTQARLQEHAAAAPILGPSIAYAPPNYDQGHATACEQWPVEPKSRYRGAFNAAGTPPILVVGTTGDPDTPYEDAVALADTLDSGHLLTSHAEGHSGWYTNPCAQAAITDYLVTGNLPAATC